MNKIIVFDIETYRALSLFSFYDYENDEWREFEISAYKNELYSFVKYMNDELLEQDVFLCGFNNLGFDSQVIEYVLRHYQEWWNMSTDDIMLNIYTYSQDVISRSRNKQWLDYREWDFKVSQLDLFKIWHYDREQKSMKDTRQSAGLKKLEFSMDFENVEDLPGNHTALFLSEEEVNEIKLYCRNDIMATYQFLKYTLGDCEHSLYKGDNKIELRKHLKEEFKLSSLNISDTKIGDEILKKEYCKKSGIKEEDLPKNGVFRKDIPIKKCIPEYVTFKTKELDQFLQRIKTKKLLQTEDFAEEVYFKEEMYDFKRGGLHNRISGKRYEADEEMILLDLDVTGYYTWVIINNQYSPSHLNKKAFIESLKVIADRRSELKPLAKTDRKIKGIVGGLKIASLSVFGKTSDMYSWLYDKLATMQTTLTGELSLLMLIESLELEGIDVIMANTDGIMVYTKRSLLNKIREIYHIWEQTTRCTMEETEFNWIAFSTVNDYIGKKVNGDIKVKGDFLQDSELHGDKSRRVVRLALYEYYTKGTPVEDFITNHKNIYDFVIGVKATGKFKYKLIDKERNEEELNKMTRYYISTKGKKLMKVKKETGKMSHAESPDRVNGAYQPLVTYFNKFIHHDDFSCYQVNYDYYILQAKATIYQVGTGKKPAKRHINPLQTSLF